jgi:hypothetical protein
MAFESGFRTTLSKPLAPADTTIYLKAVPTVTEGRLFLDNGAQQEWIEFNWISGLTLINLKRGMSKTADPATAGTGLTWLAGTRIRLVAMHDQILDKANWGNVTGNLQVDWLTIDWNETNTSATWSKTVSWTNIRIRANAGDLEFRDDSTANVKLSTLAAAAGADQYVAVSATDTTVGHLDTKLTVDTGLKVSTTNPAGDESRKIEVDVTDTDVFVKTSGGAADENKVPVLNASGQLATWFIESALAPSTVSLTAWENITIGDNLCFANTEASESIISTDWALEDGVWTTWVPNRSYKITLSSVWYYQRVNSVKVFLRKQWSPTDNITISIYNDDLVTVIDTSNTLDAATISSAAWWAEYTFTFTGSQNLIPWKTYYWVIRRSWAESDVNHIYIISNATGWASTYWSFDWTDWAIDVNKKIKQNTSITTYAVNPASVMKMDANDPLLIQDAGIATETKTTGQAIKVQMSGVVAGVQTWGSTAFTTDATSLTYTSTNNTTPSRWFRILTKFAQSLNVVTKSWTCTATTCYLKDDTTNTTLATATFVWNVATFASPYSLLNATYYRIEVWSGGSAYTEHYKVYWWLPISWTNIDYIESSADGVDYTFGDYNIISVWTFITSGSTNLTPNLYYYASDTAGALSTTPSTTYNIRIGKAISATQLLIDKKKQHFYQRRFLNTDQIYNGAAVDYNKAYSDKYIRVYTGFRPTKIRTIWGTVVQNNSFTYSCNWFSDWVNNICSWSRWVNTAPYTYYNPSISFVWVYTDNATEYSLWWTINFLDNWFEMYYTKSSDIVFASNTYSLYLWFDVE